MPDAYIMPAGCKANKTFELGENSKLRAIVSVDERCKFVLGNNVTHRAHPHSQLM